MLSIITIDEIEKWDKIVERFNDNDIYYFAAYSKAFKANGDGEPILFYYEDRDIRAMNVVMKRDIANDPRFRGKIKSNKYFDLSTPYGYGGFLIEGKVTEASIKSLEFEYSAFCQKAGIISEIVRMHPLLKNANYLGGLYEIENLGKTVTMLLNSKEEIWNNLNTNKRRWIKKSIDSGIEIYWGRDPRLFEEFKNMYFQTMKKNKAKEYYFFNDSFFDSLLEDLKYHATIFYALYKGKKVAMVLVLYVKGKIHHHFSASDKEFQHLASTNLLMYEVARWGSVNGYQTFHLGGGVGSREDSLYKFKEGFNKKSDTTFSIGKKIFDPERYKELIEIRRVEGHFDETEKFFPLYRV